MDLEHNSAAVWGIVSFGEGKFPPKKKILGINTVCSRPATPAGAALLTLIELEKYFGRHSHCLTLGSFVNFTVLCAKNQLLTISVQRLIYGTVNLLK